ncbi:PAS/PAC sensor signal transduction histidine kinase [Oceanospirillum multiglobuliferum]|uniref:Sensory histidine kinase/phosphatase NtrB n=1 Tax=Oceanospirillum multiglobuliferum TaxID=64969 RepID=A0A1T4LUJ8_9GAMM|nr:nitrogen regulation protein NR(II) [Oceanospirillum multiglobuliferum]OPX56357.1 two-component system sensor histidine kinase NtrB [Oceanospirillum multiglobuliferum]SJZ58327.1 PAS/PAC sensor signal transduction histidine kinase [Oceanospirillum multiglobuliferum]
MPISENHKLLLDNLSTAIIQLDGQLRLIYLNPAAEMLFACGANRAIGQPMSTLFTEQDQTTHNWQHAVEEGHPFTKRETVLTLPNGTQKTVDYTVNPAMTPNGYTLVVELQARDRLLRISREEELLAQQETLRTLVRGMAHEIKNPLGGIRGAAQLLERALPDDNLKDYTEVIISEADRLRNLVDRMLGPRKLTQFSEVNIHKVLEHVFALISAEALGRIKLVRDYDPSLPDLYGDQEQLIQAVLNIVRNAMQALEESGQADSQITFRTRAKRQFTLGAERHRLLCQMDIIDNGPGIPPELLESIFYPLVTGRASGTGLGLSIAQTILHQHHGLIECRSEPGKTLFRLLIPLEQKNEQAL